MSHLAQRNGGMAWWYGSIADWMLRNPDKKIEDCATFLNKNPSTISRIINSDVFKAYMAQRRREWQTEHDYALKEKLHGVALGSMDAILEQIDKKRDTLRLDVLTELMSSSLESLGYGRPASPSVQINSVVDASKHVVAVQVSAEDLAVARDALRSAEAKTVQALPDLGPSGSVEATAPAVGRGVSEIETEEGDSR